MREHLDSLVSSRRSRFEHGNAPPQGESSVSMVRKGVGVRVPMSRLRRVIIDHCGDVGREWRVPVSISRRVGSSGEGSDASDPA